MKIAIVNHTAGGVSGGYKKYLCNVIPRIALHPEIEEILLVSPESWNLQDWFIPPPNIKFVDFIFKSTNLFFPKFNKKLHDILLHYQPDTIYVPVERYLGINDIPVVTLLQNMEPFVKNINKNSFELFRQSAQYLIAKKSIISSTRIIALSDFVRSFLIEQWQIPKEKISLIYHGVDDPNDESVVKPVVVPPGWNEFLFTAGSIRPARGLEDIFKALSDLSIKGKSLNLVVAGSTGSDMKQYKNSLELLINKYNLSENVCWAGSLNEKEMNWCYKKCGLFIMSSRVESFGMIAGEAMAHGCLSISADSPCLPEIFGDAAIYYQSNDSRELAGKIREVMSFSKDEQESFMNRAINQARKYSWDVFAKLVT